MSLLDKNTINSFSSGLSNSLTFTQQERLTFALNAIRDSHDGGKPEYQSEPGNQLVGTLPLSGYVPIGVINGIDNYVVIFATDDTSSYIGLFKDGGLVTKVITNLGFKKSNIISGEFRIRNGCDKVIYWCDGNGTDYWFNFDKPELFKDALNNWDVNKFKFVPNVKVPNIDLVSVNDSGGNLKVGSYYFQAEILDKNLNVIHKTDITPQTIVYDDSFNSDFGSIDGAVNYPQFDIAAGGVLETTKSITLNFSNLDTSFAYLRINVAYKTTSNEVTQAHQVGNLIALNEESIEWIYTGFDPNSGDTVLDYSYMLIGTNKYMSSYVMEQVQNRLVRANLKEEIRDYSSYQTFANNVQLAWIAKDSLAKDQTSLGNPKNPNTYWYNTNFLGDEIYMFGIQYLHRDGTWSPVFPLIGRNAELSDLEILTVKANEATLMPGDVWLSDVEHLGLNIGDVVPKWKVFNTASITSAQITTRPFTYKGKFGYYETDYEYPDIKDCEGNSIWGDNEFQKVKLFRFPNRKLISHISGNNAEYITNLGIEVNVGSYPNSDIIGHKIVHAVRNETDKTITDSGWTISEQVFSPENLLLISSGWADQGPSKQQLYISPTIQYNNKITKCDYIARNKVYKMSTNTIPNLAATTQYTSVNNNAVRSAIIYTQDLAFDNTTRTNYKVEKQLLINPGQKILETVLGFNINNEDYFNHYGLLITKTDVEDHISSNGGQNVDSLLAFGTYVNEGNTVYTNKKVLIQPYKNFFNLQFRNVHFNPSYGNAITQHYGGDTVIVPNTMFMLTNYTMYKLNEDNAANLFESTYNDMFWCETDLSTHLRYGGTSVGNSYFRRGKTDLDHMLKFTDLIEEGTSFKLQFKPREFWLSEYYKLNNDFNLKKQDQSKFMLPRNYDTCSNCFGEYRNRIIYSPVSFDEEVNDNYRINLVNDYVDLPGHRGKITGVIYKNNRLLVHCEDSTFILQPNPQVIATDSNSAYLSTADFLSIPPQELLQTDLGYAGCQSKQHYCNTPFGHVWIDQRRGQVFLFDGELKELSAIELTQWFKENLPSETANSVQQVFGTSYPNNTTTNAKGYGVILYYDPRFKRLIISKKDYKPIKLVGQFSRDPQEIFYNTVTDVWTDYYNNVIVYGNDLNFENKSWTLSFSFEYNSWTSWHSYRPLFAFSDDMFFYTSTGRTIFQHLHKNRYQNFYGIKYDFIIEWMNYDLETENTQAIHYTGYTLQYDAVNKQWLEMPDITFDRGMFYNFNQSTGLLNLTYLNQQTNPYGNVTLPVTSKFVIKTDQNYKISGLYDFATTRPVITSDWNDLKTHVGYIDILPKNIDYTKSIYTTGTLRDKFLFNRLYFKPVTDCKKVIILSNNYDNKSIR